MTNEFSGHLARRLCRIAALGHVSHSKNYGLRVPPCSTTNSTRSALLKTHPSWVYRILAAAAAVAIFVGLLPGVSLALDPSRPDCNEVAQVTEVASGVFVRPGHHGVVFEQDDVANVGFVVGKRCVAVIDTGGSPDEGQALRCAILRETDLPVCYVINSHVHPDHMLGNVAFQGNGVEFVGHANLERAMALLGATYLERAARQAGHPLGSRYIVLPDRAVDQTLELDLGGRVLRIAAHAKAHTDNDLSIYDTKTGTLWLSDLLFMEHVPVVAGSLKGWLEVLKTLGEIPAERVVPGHGPVQAPWPEAAQGLTQYLTVLLEQTRAWMAEDGDLPGAMQRVGRSEKTNWKLFDNYHQRNVTAAYTELEWE